MPLTRRSLLRSATLASMASAFAASPILLTGCNEHRKFKYGVRIFFEGGWVFYADPFDPDLMRAVALNPRDFIVPTPPSGSATAAADTASPTCPPTQTMPRDQEPQHIFPYGVWDEQSDWVGRQKNAGNCVPNNPPATPKTRLVPYPVVVRGTKNPACRVDDLFQATDTTSLVTYLMNPGKIYEPDCGCSGLRVISMPFPTRIIPAGFRTDANVCDSGNLLHKHGECADTGVATTLIFDYIGAHSLTFTPPGKPTPITMAGGTDFASDFHFHAVPEDPYHLPLGHDQMMFNHLLTFVNPCLPGRLILDRPNCSTIPIQKGHLVPTSVTENELEIRTPPAQCVQTNFMQVNLATCGSGPLAVGHGRGTTVSGM